MNRRSILNVSAIAASGLALLPASSTCLFRLGPNVSVVFPSGNLYLVDA